MTFAVETPDGSRMYVDAPSWYDAREWARRIPGACVYLSQVEGVDVVIVPRTTLTAHEYHVEHCEALYDKGRRDGIEHAQQVARALAMMG